MPAAMTKEQYHEQGRKAAAEGQQPAPLMVNKGTWQARAYMAGFRGESLPAISVPAPRTGGVTRAGGSVPPPPMAVTFGARREGKSILASALSMAPNTQHWPRAAREHAKELIADVATERNPRRRMRLVAALHRMNKRHTPKQQGMQ